MASALGASSAVPSGCTATTNIQPREAAGAAVTLVASRSSLSTGAARKLSGTSSHTRECRRAGPSLFVQTCCMPITSPPPPFSLNGAAGTAGPRARCVFRIAHHAMLPAGCCWWRCTRGQAYSALHPRHAELSLPARRRAAAHHSLSQQPPCALLAVLGMRRSVLFCCHSDLGSAHPALPLTAFSHLDTTHRDPTVNCAGCSRLLGWSGRGSD